MEAEIEEGLGVGERAESLDTLASVGSCPDVDDGVSLRGKEKDVRGENIFDNLGKVRFFTEPGGLVGE